MSFGEKLAKYLEEHHIEQKELAKLLGVKEQTVSAYITKKNNPTYKRFVQICTQLKIDANYFVNSNITSTNHGLNPEDQSLIDKYKSLTPHDREIIDHIFDMEADEPIKIYYFPVFYQSAAAGIGRLSETEEYQMKEFKLKSIPKKAAFGMFIKGHSMETNIYENDIVLIDPSVKVSNDLEDEIVVALFGDELVCKRFSVNEDDQTYDFTSDNLVDKDKGRFHQKRNNFTLVGKVVKIIHAHEIGNGLFTYSGD